MKMLRLSEVLLPLLAARGWAPWPIEPGVRARSARAREPGPAPNRARWDDRQVRRVPFEDVQ